MNQDIIWDIIIVVYGGAILFLLIAFLLQKPRPKFKIPYPFIVGALWGSLAGHTIETDKRVTSYIFVGLLGIMLLLAINARAWRKERESNKSSTRV